MGSPRMDRRFDSSQPAPLTPPRAQFKEASRRSTRPATSEDFSVPMRWSGWIGFLAGLFAVFCYGVTWKLGWWDFDIVWAILLFGLVTAGICLLESNWFKQQLWVGGEILQIVESITGQDINHDGQIGRYVPPPQITAYEFHKSPTQTVRGDLPGPDHIIRKWGAVALTRGSLAFAAWDDHFGYTERQGKRISVYRLFREYLVDHGLATENKTHGIRLNDQGREMFEGYLNTRPEDAVPVIEAPREEKA